jgi:hypothetical protein
MTFASWKRFVQITHLAGLLRVAVVFLASLILGCGSGGSGTGLSPEAEHIGKVGALIGEFKLANSGNNPKNIDELKNWAIKKGKAEENDFISTRDKEPYVLEHMAMMRGGGPTGSSGDMSFMATKMPVVLHENKGKNGNKFMVQGSAPIGSEMTNESIQYLVKGRPTTSSK